MTVPSPLSMHAAVAAPASPIYRIDSMPGRFRGRVEVQPDAVSAMLDALRTWLDRQDLPARMRGRTTLAIDELLQNQVMHGAGYLARGAQGHVLAATDDNRPRSNGRRITVMFELRDVTDDTLALRWIDTGPPFDPFDVEPVEPVGQAVDKRTDASASGTAATGTPRTRPTTGTALIDCRADATAQRGKRTHQAVGGLGLVLVRQILTHTRYRRVGQVNTLRASISDGAHA